MNYHGLDNQLDHKLPEGVSVNFTPAGLSARINAYLFDLAIRSVIFIAIAFALNYFGETGAGLTLVAYFVISWGYYIYFEARDGTTPGKRRLGLRVIQDNGLPATIQHIILRNLVRAADAFPFSYCLGMAVIAANKEFKRMGDWVAGTIVIHDLPKEQHQVPETALPEFSIPKLSTEEQKIIIAFAERSEKLSEARQQELADILAPILKGKGSHSHEKLKQLAHYYVGQGV